MQHGLMVLCCTDGNAGSSKGTKSVKYTLQELQGKTNKALMVRALQLSMCCSAKHPISQHQQQAALSVIARLPC